MKNNKNNIIANWLEKNSNPEIDKFVEKNLAIANKIHAILDERGLKPADLAKLLDKSPSEISKWLSGMHNLTLKSITKIETVLGIELVHIEPEKEYIYFKVTVNQDIEEDTLFEDSQVFVTGFENEKKAS